MQISTEVLSYLATEAAGRDVPVRFFSGYIEEKRVEGAATQNEIMLARHGWERRGDKCHTFLHELGHVLFRHAGRVLSERAEREADQFAETVIARAGATWFDWAVRRSILKEECDHVLGVIAQVWREMQPARTSTTPATRAIVAMGAPELRAKLDHHQALLAKWRSENRLTPQLEQALGRTVDGLRGLITGQATREENPEIEYATFPARMTAQ